VLSQIPAEYSKVCVNTAQPNFFLAEMSVWPAQLVKALAAPTHVRSCVQEVRVRSPERTSSTLAALDLEPLELRRLKSDLVLYYKCSHDFVALPSSEYFTVSNVTSQTRTGGNRLLRPLCCSKLYENDFFNRCVYCWNFLTYTVVNSSSISCFKRLLSNVDLSSFACCPYF